MADATSNDHLWNTVFSGAARDALRWVLSGLGGLLLRYINRHEDLIKENERLKRENALLAAANKFGISAGDP